MKESNIRIYQVDNGETEISVHLENDSVWLSLVQITELFQRDKSVISRHLNNVFNENELSREATVAKIATVQSEGERKVERNIIRFKWRQKNC